MIMTSSLKIYGAALAALTVFLQVTAAQSNTQCQACNCQFNNVQVLKQLIEDMVEEKVSRTFASQSTAGMQLILYTESLL